MNSINNKLNTSTRIISSDVEQLIMPNQSTYVSFIQENGLLLHPACI